MEKLRIAAMIVLSILFLGACVMAFAPYAGPYLTPILARFDDRSGQFDTQAAVGIEPGAATVFQRPDLTPPPPESTEYTEPAILPEALRIEFRTGLSFRQGWVFDGGTGPGLRPTVFLFHGANRDATSMIEMWQATARREGLLLVSLQSAAAAWPNNTGEAEVIGDLLHFLELAEIPVDRDAMFLFGHSSGAGQAQLVANRVAGPWVAVAAHAGYPDPAQLHPIADAPPVRHYLGSADGIFSTDDAQFVIGRQAFLGHDAELHIIPFHSHWYYEIGPAIADDAWAWFATYLE